MNVFVRLDLEGVSGVVSYAQVEPGEPDYPYGQQMAVSDINAAVEGCFEGGAARVVVYDMHCHARNIPLDQFDARGELICGKPTLSRRLLEQFDALMLVGFHGKAGSGTLLAHTYESDTLDIRINGRSMGEVGVEATLAGELGTPLILVTGDSAGCAEARELVPDVRTVAVKTSLSAGGALCLPTEKTRALIRAAAAEAVREAHEAQPVSIAHFELLEIDLPSPPPLDMARLEETPGTQWDGQTLVIEADTAYEAWQTYQRLREVADGGQQP